MRLPLSLSKVCAQYALCQCEWLPRGLVFLCSLGGGPAIMYVVRLPSKNPKSLQAFPRIHRLTKARKRPQEGEEYERKRILRQDEIRGTSASR